MKRIFILTILVSTWLLGVSCSSNENETKVNDGAGIPSIESQEMEVETTSESEQSIKNGKATVLDFSATWCGPCKRFKPIFDDVAREYGKTVNFKTIDVDENPTLAAQYRIEAVPTVIFLNKKGIEIDRVTGLMDKATFVNKVKSLK